MSGMVTLTFDDGMPGHLRYALPELDQRGLKGTFFVVQAPARTARHYDTEFRTAGWRRAAANDHEIGGHSVTHMFIDEMRRQPGSAAEEIRTCKAFLEETLQVPVRSYAYPFGYTGSGLRAAAALSFQQARGTGERSIRSGNRVDFYDLPAIRIHSENVATAPALFDQAAEQGLWLTLMFHGIGQPGTFDNISLTAFAILLNELCRRDLEVKPFDVATDCLRQSQTVGAI